MTRKSHKDKPKKHRLNIDLNEEAYSILVDLSQKTGKSKAEVLRTSLALFKIAFEAKQKGQSLAIIDDIKVIKEIEIVLISDIPKT